MNILVVHSSYETIGGAELVSLRILSLLSKCGHKVTIFTTSMTNFNILNKKYQLNLDKKNIKVINNSGIFAHYGKLFSHSLLIRKLINYLSHNDYDIVFSTYSEISIPKIKVIQYVHYPLFSANRDDLYNLGMPRNNPIIFIIRYLYVKICKIIAKVNANTVKNNITITNSFWTKKIVDKIYDLNSHVIYPGPGISVNSEINFSQKKQYQFVMLGRITKSKRFMEAIKILETVREKGYPINLLLVGNIAKDVKVTQLRYIQSLKWVKIISNKSNYEVGKILKESSFGIHCYQSEHYGMAIVDMLNHDLPVFVHNSGGQIEIVEDEKFIYNNFTEAVEKIINVLKNENIINLNNYEHRSLHSINSFEKAVNRILEL